MKAALTGMIIVGFVLLALSSIWTRVSSGESNWTEEKAERAVEVKARMAYLGGQINRPKVSMHAGSDLGTLKAEFEALKEENERLDADFHSASTGPPTMAKIFRWSGIGLAIIGLIGVYATRQNS